MYRNLAMKCDARLRSFRKANRGDMYHVSQRVLNADLSEIKKGDRPKWRFLDRAKQNMRKINLSVENTKVRSSIEI